MKDVDGSSSPIGAGGAKGSADSGAVGGMDQGCQVGESDNGAALHVFLTDEDVDAINRLDGTLGS